MSKFQITYDAIQHATALQQDKGRSLALDSCTATGGKGEELSPGELVGAAVAGCMLFSMGVVALRDELDLTGTTVDIDVALGQERIESIDLGFTFPPNLAVRDGAKLERAAASCPIKRSFLPEVTISSRFTWPEPAGTGS